MNALAPLRTANRLLGHMAPGLAAALARRLLMTPMRHSPRASEQGVLADAEPVTFRFGQTGLRWGHSGPFVLALHGWSGRPTQFAAFIRPLLAAGYQVVALEGPAHGRSQAREAHVFDFARDLLEAASELRDVRAVIGHSMGGAAALYASQLGLPAARVATIGAPAALARVLHRFADNLALPPPAARRFWRAVDRHVGIAAAELDIERWAGSLAVEGLVVHDRDDREVPFAEAQAMLRAWPRATALLTQGLGHGRILADPSVVAAVVAFVSADSGRQAATRAVA